MDWEPIRPFELNGEVHGSSELESLRIVWAFYQKLYGPNVTASLQARFNREWSIETGQIEGAYDLDRGVTETLLDHGFKESLISRQQNGKSAEQVASILRDQVEAVEGLFEFVKTESLTTSYIRQLHQQLMRSEPTYTVYTADRIPINKPLEKGKYKTEANSPYRPNGEKHEYCPAEHTAAEMDRLLAIYNEQTALPVEIQAAWLHHAFTQIHPFQDGNGRVARALASLVLIKSGLFPFVVFREERGRYISCLEAADRGDLTGLIELFRRSQRNAILRVSEWLMITQEKRVESADTVLDILSSIKSDLINSGALPREEWSETPKRVEHLIIDLARRRLEAVKAAAQNDFKDFAKFEVHEYFSESYDLKITSDRGVALSINNGTGTIAQIGFYANLPLRFRGLAVFYSRYIDANGQSERYGETFLVNWVEEAGAVDRRFALWIEDHLKAGLQRWREALPL